jgi:hypothetical protein
MFEIIAAQNVSLRTKIGSPGYNKSRELASITYACAKKLADQKDAEKAVVEKKRYLRKLYTELKAAELEFAKAVRGQRANASSWGREVSNLKAAIREANMEVTVATEVAGW